MCIKNPHNPHHPRHQADGKTPAIRRKAHHNNNPLSDDRHTNFCTQHHQQARGPPTEHTQKVTTRNTTPFQGASISDTPTTTPTRYIHRHLKRGCVKCHLKRMFNNCPSPSLSPAPQNPYSNPLQKNIHYDILPLWVHITKYLHFIKHTARLYDFNRHRQNRQVERKALQLQKTGGRVGKGGQERKMEKSTRTSPEIPKSTYSGRWKCYI